MFKQLMVQGTSSDAGKSTICTALCHWLAQLGVGVAPFKPQNMALNSAVTIDGGEIGRAQAVQAQAAGIDCHTDMNPVLLKPNSDTGSQIIIQGKAIGNMNARQYHQYKKTALTAVLDSYQRLAQQYPCIIIEGAGSPAEINLREHDIANMGFAEAVDCPVILVADIHPGGVFAQLYGTLALLSSSEQQRVLGFVINRFRGDKSLLQPGIDWLQQETGKPVFGVLPWIDNLYLDAEDSMALDKTPRHQGPFRVIVPRLPRISNHTDFDPLIAHPGIDFQFVDLDAPLNAPWIGAELIILPGSKSVISDLQQLRQHGWLEKIQGHLRYGGKLMGICGGLQMLGKSIQDPHLVESRCTFSEGLDLLELDTQLQASKQLTRQQARLSWCDTPISGYEIHSGVSQGPAFTQAAMILNNGQTHGVLSSDNQILATYLHGLFDEPQACDALLHWAGYRGQAAPSIKQLRQDSFARLSQTVKDHINLPALLQAIHRFENLKEVNNESSRLDTICQ